MKLADAFNVLTSGFILLSIKLIRAFFVFFTIVTKIQDSKYIFFRGQG